MNRKSKVSPALSRLPTKWVIGLLVLLMGYVWLQPILNQQFGWNLPALSTADSKAEQDFESSPSGPPTTFGRSSVADGDATAGGPTYGVLKDLGGERYLSPAGLLYTRGSQEGHRLLHIERHLRDDPGRPGSHGVFSGGMEQVLLWLDETYEKALSNERGTKQRTEDERTVFEATFDQSVGYVGGQAGNRNGKPKTNQIRLVVEGSRVITAFPF